MATRRSYPSKSTAKSKSPKSSTAILPFSVTGTVKSFFAFCSRILSSISDELWAIFLGIGSLILLLSLVSNSIGWAGSLIREWTGDVLGVGRFFLIGIFLFVAVKLFLKGINDSETERASNYKSTSIRTATLGSLVALIVFSSMINVLAGPYSLHAKMIKLYKSGGLAGSLLGTTLSSLFGSVGSFLILVAIMLASVVVVFAITFSNIKHLFESSRNYLNQRRVRRNELELKTRQRLSGNKPGNDEAEVVDDINSKRQSKSDRTKVNDEVPDLGAVGDSGNENSESDKDEIFHPTKMSDLNIRSSDNGEKLTRTQMSLPLIDESVTKWLKPSAKLLVNSSNQKMDEKLVEDAGSVLVNALLSHGVETTLSSYTVGPTVTRYELELAPGVKVAKVTSLSKDIAYAMASPDVRILAPIPGKSAIGIEVPNRIRQLVTLGDLISVPEFKKSVHPLEVPIGRNIAGKTLLANLAEMPHILIAGATGAGKSSCINSLLVSLLMKATPEELRMILIDPKRVELGQYNGLPHLLTEVVVNPKLAANKLKWAVEEMERRYDLLAAYGFRDIGGYHDAYNKGELLQKYQQLNQNISPMESDDKIEGSTDDDTIAKIDRLPYILIVVDELNDLMMVASHEVEDSICRLAQMARAVGIHLVIATQRPSVDVITGVIKANIPSRLAFSVSSIADSRVILDQAGAERLIGRGDMLLLTSNSSIPTRLQGPWVSEKEIHQIVGFWKKQSSPVFLEELRDASTDDPANENNLITDGDDDDLVPQAMELVIKSGLGSTSMLTRKLKIGYPRAGRIMDILEERGVVGPADGSKPRQVYKTAEDLNDLKSS